MPFVSWWFVVGEMRRKAVDERRKHVVGEEKEGRWVRRKFCCWRENDAVGDGSLFLLAFWNARETEGWMELNFVFFCVFVSTVGRFHVFFVPKTATNSTLFLFLAHYLATSTHIFVLFFLFFIFSYYFLLLVSRSFLYSLLWFFSLVVSFSLFSLCFCCLPLFLLRILLFSVRFALFWVFCLVFFPSLYFSSFLFCFVLFSFRLFLQDGRKAKMLLVRT